MRGAGANGLGVDFWVVGSPCSAQKACPMLSRRSSQGATKVMADPHVREQLAKLYIRSDFAPAAVLRTKLESEIRDWTKFIDEKDIKPE
jgi:tripartite-type tricarboxylate transporter receptor subunit TctC